MPPSRKNLKNRKTNRKNLKNRKTNRKNKKSRRCWGGAYNPMELSLRQGEQFADQHRAQHGGAATVLGGAPVGDTGMLPQELRDMARISPLDGHIQAAGQMHDSDQQAMRGGGHQLGEGFPVGGDSMLLSHADAQKAMVGGKSRKNRKSRKNQMRKSRKSQMRKSRKSQMRKSRKNQMRKSRKSQMRKRQSGGSHLWGSPVDAPAELLSPNEAQKAGTADFTNPYAQN